MSTALRSVTEPKESKAKAVMGKHNRIFEAKRVFHQMSDTDETRPTWTVDTTKLTTASAALSARLVPIPDVT